MWCKNCSHETNSTVCEKCNQETEPVIPTEVYWCSHCNVPIIKELNKPQAPDSLIYIGGVVICKNNFDYPEHLP